MISRLRLLALVFAIAPALAGCDLLPDPAAEAAKQEAEAAAVGAGCRQSGRSIEQCLIRNERLSPKAGVLKGWREMDDYMRSNKIESQVPPPDPKPEPKKKSDDDEASASSDSADASESGGEASASEEEPAASDGSGAAEGASAKSEEH